MTIDTFGGRKFIFAMFVVGCGLWLSLVNSITFDQFMGITVWALGIFSVTNAVAHLSDK